MNKSVWKREHIEEVVKQIIVDKLGVKPEEVANETLLMEDLGADSLDAVEIIMDMEDRFRINIPDEDADKVSTVGEAVSLLERLLKERES